ncbi:MAG TPA: hypothetical protein VGO56_22560 [Pyrinomonadaceae bacterium]|jgi:hypothetical protein|nr:hypothetical protein [Pyrinomonadaceae bacterium]
MLTLPHRYDRYRLIALVLDHQKKLIPQLSQLKLEDLTHLDQSTISRLLSKSVLGEKGRRNSKLKRESLLALTRSGLKMDQYQASLMLWLSEGEDFKPWRDKEFLDLQLTPPTLEEKRAANALSFDPWQTHMALIDLLERICLADRESTYWYPVETQLLQGNSAAHHLALFQKLKAMESLPGQRMLVSKYPSVLISTDAGAGGELLAETSETVRGELRQIMTERQKILRQNLYRYGERAIHSVLSLKRFVSAEFSHPIPLTERKNRVSALIDFLEKNERFEVGLLDQIEPEIEIAIKSTEAAIVRGTARELSNHPQTVVCGPSYMYWKDERAVLRFYLDFEKLWATLHQAGLTEKRGVLRRLKQVLK